MELATATAQDIQSASLDQVMHVERLAFAAKLRAARAVLGLSQDQFGFRVGLTQRSIHRIEQADVQPKMRTILLIERFLTSQGIAFEELRDGGFRLIVDSSVLLRD